MKKILAFILAVLMLVASGLALAVPAFAAETYGYMGDSEPYGTGEIAVTHHSYSTFQLEIPLNADSSYANYITALNPNLEDGYQIEVYVTNLNEDGTITMTHTSGEVSYMTLYSETDVHDLTYQQPMLAAFSAEDFINGQATSIFWIQGGDPFNMKAGEHSGVICYRIECNPIT